MTRPASGGLTCATCHLEIPARQRATETRDAFTIGAILAAVPLLFLLTTPGAIQPGLWARMAICTGGGVVGVLFWRRSRGPRICPLCR